MREIALNLSGRLCVSGAKWPLCYLIVMKYGFYRTRVPFIFFARVDVNARFHCNRHICITRAGNALSLIASDQSHRFVLTLSVSAASERQNTIHLTKMQALLKQNTRIISRGWELGARDFPTAAKVNKKRHVHQDSRSFVTLVGGEKIARIFAR